MYLQGRRLDWGKEEGRGGEGGHKASGGPCELTTQVGSYLHIDGEDDNCMNRRQSVTFENITVILKN